MLRMYHIVNISHNKAMSPEMLGLLDSKVVQSITATPDQSAAAYLNTSRSALQ